MSVDNDSYNRGGLIAFVFSMAFSILFFVYIAFIHPGIDLKEVDQEAMQVLAGTAPAKFNPKNVEKPWVSTEDMIAHGKKSYGLLCASCHGDSGKGDGPAGAALNPKPRDLVTGGWKQGGSTMDLYKTLQVGVPGTAMVAFKHVAAADRWAMVHFVRSITKDKPDDDMSALESFAASAD